MENQIEFIKVAIATVVTAFCAFFGILAVPLILLFGANFIDYLTAIAAAKVNGEAAVSKVGIKGIFKKVAMYLWIFVAWMVSLLIVTGTSTIPAIANVIPDQLNDPNLLAAGVCYWIILNELISITENLEKMGTTVPVLQPLLKLVRVKVEDTIPESLRGDDNNE